MLASPDDFTRESLISRLGYAPRVRGIRNVNRSNRHGGQRCNRSQATRAITPSQTGGNDEVRGIRPAAKCFCASSASTATCLV
jgi:hypothetical protein